MATVATKVARLKLRSLCGNSTSVYGVSCFEFSRSFCWWSNEWNYNVWVIIIKCTTNLPCISLGKNRCNIRLTKRVKFGQAFRWFCNAALGSGAFNNGPKWANTTASSDEGVCPKKNSLSPSFVANKVMHSSAAL